MGGAWKAMILALAMVSTALTGCVGVDNPLEAQSTEQNLDELVGDVIQLREDDGFVQEVPVQVVLVGFEPGTAEALEERLEPEEVRHAALSFTRNFPPDPDRSSPSTDDLVVPHTPKAIYDVQQMDASFADAFLEEVSENPIEGEEGVYDANAAEDALAERLPEAGVELNPDVPTFVVLHDGDRLDDHSWRFTYENGYLEPVRAFGERYGFTVYDTSATPDPYVVGDGPSPTDPVLGGSGSVEGYNYEMEAGGQETVALLDDLVIDATHYRLLKGAIYPISTKACHKVTLVLAVHQTALTEMPAAFRDAGTWVNADRQEAAFENATGDEVTVDLKTITLPQDDPVLDATTRRAAGMAGSSVFLDTMRWYLDENWEQYVDTEPGCEDYLSLLLFADASSEIGRGFSGIGMYDINTDRRISFSVVTDAYRAQAAYDGPAKERISVDDETHDPDYVNRLYSHETGHILGLHHPQHLFRADGEGSPSNDAFQSVWSSMSYQTGDRTIDFGDVDRSQFQRNRAGYIVEQAQKLDLENTTAFQQAIQAAGVHDWAGVQAALEDVVIEQVEQTDAQLVPHVGGHHQHPW